MRDLSNNITVNPPLFSLDNTFNSTLVIGHVSSKYPRRAPNNTTTPRGNYQDTACYRATEAFSSWKRTEIRLKKKKKMFVFGLAPYLPSHEQLHVRAQRCLFTKQDKIN
jgi:hypothetical protein